MRIAYVTFEYPPFIIGGAGIHAKRITKELAQLGHEVVVFTPAMGGRAHNEESMQNVNIVRVPVHMKLPFRALHYWLSIPREIRKIERDGKFDIVHFNGFSYWFFQRRIADAPHVLTVHHLVTDAVRNNQLNLFSRLKDISGENSIFYSYVEKRCIQSADQIIAVSKFTRAQILREYSLDESKVDVIYNGTDENRTTISHSDLDDLRKIYEIPVKPVILFVGRLNDPRKGLEILLKAFKLVSETVDATLLVVGKGAIEEVIDLDDDIKKKIIVTGYVDEETLRKIYALCDVYVCPSRLEGFGLTILEAYAAGKPVVATIVGAIPELLEHGKNGSLVAMDDYEGMAAEIILFLQNPSLSIAIGQSNKESLRNTFSWNESARRLEKIYKQL